MGLKQIVLSDLFDVVSGDYHAFKELESGTVPLVSCGDTDNGVVGYYNIPEDRQYARALTVAYNGSWPIMSKFHPYKFGAKDDVAVLKPRYAMGELSLLYIAALLNRMTWRYSYGRKCFKEKLEQVELPIPVTNGDARIDEAKLRQLFPTGMQGLIQHIARGAGEWLKTENTA
jgi:hypothetical protein